MIPSPRPPRHQRLIEFQARRLRGTFSDFVRSERYARIVEFFFADVYSTEDKTERDAQFKTLYQFFRRRLGETLTAGIGDLIALNEFSDELDHRMIARLRRDAFDESDYEEAYRCCDNYRDRVRQIEMLCRSIRYFRSLAERRTIGLVLKAVKSAALLFGGHTVMAFLDRGYHAYRSVTTEETEIFVQAVHDRELARLDRIYGCPGWEKRGRW